MSKLTQFVALSLGKPDSQENRVNLTIRVDRAIKDEAQRLFTDQLGKLFDAAMADAIAQVKSMKGAKS
jgi:acetolactate synthase regulatory subunit